MALANATKAEQETAKLLTEERLKEIKGRWDVDSRYGYGHLGNKEYFADVGALLEERARMLDEISVLSGANGVTAGLLAERDRLAGRLASVEAERNALLAVRNQMEEEHGALRKEAEEWKAAAERIGFPSPVPGADRMWTPTAC